MATALGALVPALGAGSAAAASSSGAFNVLSILGGLITGLAEVSAANAAARTAEYNAETAAQNAVRAIQTSQVAEQELDAKARQEMGFMLSEAAASGLAVGSGSVVGRRVAQSELAAKDRGFTRREAEVDSVNFKRQEQQFRQEAKDLRRQAAFGMLSTMLNVGSSLVSGATKVSQATARGITNKPVTISRTSSYRPTVGSRPRLRPPPMRYPFGLVS